MLEGARKCKACKAWVSDPRLDPPAMGVGTRAEPRFPRAALIVATAVAAVMAVIVTARESPVGEAPPLTALGADTATARPAAAPEPALGGDTEADPDPTPLVPAPERRWHVMREIRIGDVHPLDILWNPKGQSVYVSCDDATLREYKLKSGELIHQAAVAAQGDSIRLLFDRFIAVLRQQEAARIPVLDTTAWDRDPVLLDVGRSPGDIVELPDGKGVVAATKDGKRVTRFELPGGVRIANIALPHATGQLFLVRAEGRPYLAAMGALFHAGRPAGAWIDLFDPAETPFGATRRSISVGREPMDGSVTRDGAAIFFPDRVANTATLLQVAATTDAKLVAVGQSPEAGFLVDGDRFGITINSASRTASVIDLSTMALSATLMLDGPPRSGATSPDGSTLFVSLGGTEVPPKGSGVAVISGSPPKVVASLPTGEGAMGVAVSKDGTRAVVANYWDKSLTVLER
jgi:DNA-binding beta-propeller fold protein YncE